MRNILSLSLLLVVMIPVPMATALDLSQAALEKVIMDNIAALNAEDLDGAMNTIDPESTSFKATRDMTEQLFRDYDIRYTLESLKVLSITPEKAEVEVVQVTRNYNDREFSDNRMDLIHELRPYNGQWKLYNTTIVKTDYL